MSAPDQIRLDVLELEDARKVVDGLLNVEVALTRIDVNTDESVLRKRMHADVTLGDHDKARVSPEIFLAVAREVDDVGRRNFSHPKPLRQLIERRKHRLHIIQAFWVSAIPVEGQVSSKIPGLVSENGLRFLDDRAAPDGLHGALRSRS